MSKLVWKHKSDDSECTTATRRPDGAWLCLPHGRLVYWVSAPESSSGPKHASGGSVASWQDMQGAGE